MAMRSLTAPQQYKDLSGQAWTDHFKTSHTEGYPDSEHLIAWDDRFSTGGRFQREEQIRREVEHALAVQKLSRARKAKKSASGAHDSLGDSSLVSNWCDRDSLVNRGRARQNSVYTPRVAPYGDFSYYGTSDSVSRSHVSSRPPSSRYSPDTHTMPPSPKKSTSLSRLNPFKTPAKKLSTSGVDNDPRSRSEEEDSSQESGSWAKKLQHIAIIVILGYDPDAKGEPIL